MKIPLLQGAYADSAAAFRTSYPVNLEPTLVDSGLSKGYLTNAPGVALVGTGPGPDRGAINWNGVCYRVMGSKLVMASPNGTVATLGDVGDNGLPVTLDYSFDRLVIWSDRKQFYYNAAEGVTQVTDPDLGLPISGLWIDSYFLSTDGENLVVTELNDPYSVDPLKYGSSDADPDPIVGVCKVRGELYALNRYTIQNFQDLGTTGFPFSNNPGGLIPRGVVGTQAWTYFLEQFAFVGSGRNEQLSVYIAGAGQSINISTSEIDEFLAEVSVDEQALIECESRVEKGEQRLYIHLPTRSLVYMRAASEANQAPVWHVLEDGAGLGQAYGPRHMALCDDKWMVGDSGGRLGVLDASVATRFGDTVGWRFETTLLYNQGLGAIVKMLELAGLPGRAPFGVDPTVAFSYTLDGQTWSQERFISMGAFGERQKRVQWRPKVRMRNYMGLRFRSANVAMASWAALQADVEPLSV
jgi:hypothetical protein